MLLLTGNLDISTSRPAKRLHSKDLIVIIARLETMALPGGEVVADRHRAGRPLVLTNRKVLPESGGADDRGLVDLSVRADFVR